MGKKELDEFNNLNKVDSKKHIHPIIEIILGIFLLYAVIFPLYTHLFRNDESKQIQIVYREPTQAALNNYIQDNHLIKLGNEYAWYEVKEHGEMKPLTDILERNCKNDYCKIENYYRYVIKMKYEEGTKRKNKNPIDIIMNAKGDCDERSYLLASMMLQGNYECIIIYTKDHAFAGINIPNYNTDERKSYFEYKNKKFYYAETTNANGYIGAYNGIDPKEITHIYSVNEKREIRTNEIKAQIYL